MRRPLIGAACLLTGCASMTPAERASELSYHIDDELSNEIKGILEKIIEQHQTAMKQQTIHLVLGIFWKLPNASIAL